MRHPGPGSSRVVTSISVRRSRSLWSPVTLRRQPAVATTHAGIAGLLTVAACCFPLFAKTVFPYYLLEPYIFALLWWLARPGSALNWRAWCRSCSPSTSSSSRSRRRYRSPMAGAVTSVLSSAVIAVAIALVTLDLIRLPDPCRPRDRPPVRIACTERADAGGVSMTIGPGRFLLLGSGEFEPWAGEAERFALADAPGDGSVAVLATASAREGDAVFERWIGMGLAHYTSLGHRGAGAAGAHSHRRTRHVDGEGARRREHGLLQRRQPQVPRSDACAALRCGMRCCDSSKEAACSPDAAPGP